MLLLVIVYSRQVTKSLINVLLFLIERNSSLRQRFMYYVHGLRITIRGFYLVVFGSLSSDFVVSAWS